MHGRSQERPLICSICNKAFYKRDSLKKRPCIFSLFVCLVTCGAGNFSPVWGLLCLVKSSLYEYLATFVTGVSIIYLCESLLQNALSHIEQMNGLSSVWIVSYIFYSPQCEFLNAASD